MKRVSRRSVIISIVIALIVHLVLLVALFLSVYRMYLHEMHDPEEITVLTQMGSTGTSVTLYQPPVQTVSWSSSVATEPDAAYEPSVSLPLASDMLTMLDEPAPLIEMPRVPVSEPDAQYTETAHLKEIEQEISVQPIRQKQRRISPRKRRQAAVQQLKGLSFLQSAHDAKPAMVRGDRGVADHTNVRDIVYQRYVHKVMQMMVAAINAERLRISIDEPISCLTTLFVKVQRDGKMVDFYFESAHPTLRQLEHAAQPVVQASWLYLPIPDSIAKDFIIIPMPIHVRCRRGFDTYQIQLAERYAR